MKTGGRQKGTKNKPNPLKERILATGETLKDVLLAHSAKYYCEPVEGDGRSQFEIDLEQLTPGDRVAAESKLLAKSVPDLKSLDANVSGGGIRVTIEDRLRTLCENGDN